jgi:putative SOS response-associated peptidase YedK
VGAVWGGPDAGHAGDEPRPALRTCTVITTGAGPDMGDFHHRMPVVEEDETLDQWLDPANRDKPELIEPTGD